MSTIVHLTAPAQYGGLESVVSALATATAARGNRVVVLLALSPGVSVPSWAESLGKADVTVEIRHVGARAYLQERRLVRDLLKREKATVAHTHGYRSDILHRSVAHSLGVPTISTAHGFASRKPNLSLNERLQVWSWRRYDCVVAVSGPLRDHLARLGVPSDRLAMIRNGLSVSSDPLPRLSARGSLRLDPSAPVIGWVGRLSEEKDPCLAIEALAAMSGAQAHLCFVGDGPLRPTCEKRAQALGVASRVHFAGARSDAATLMKAFDTLVLSSRTEGTPMTILEAALAEVPIVATAVGGVPDVLGSEGELVAAGDRDALAAALGRSLRERGSALANAVALRSRLLAREHQEDWVGQYLALYEALKSR